MVSRLMRPLAATAGEQTGWHDERAADDDRRQRRELLLAFELGEPELHARLEFVGTRARPP